MGTKENKQLANTAFIGDGDYAKNKEKAIKAREDMPKTPQAIERLKAKKIQTLSTELAISKREFRKLDQEYVELAVCYAMEMSKSWWRRLLDLFTGREPKVPTVAQHKAFIGSMITIQNSK